MRDIDEVIEQVNKNCRLNPVEKQVIINRLEKRPTQEELDLAAAQVSAKRHSGWN